MNSMGKEEWTFVLDATSRQRDLLRELEELKRETGATREISLAITKLEESIMWLNRAYELANE
jgi:hypothetical protein